MNGQVSGLVSGSLGSLLRFRGDRPIQLSVCRMNFAFLKKEDVGIGRRC